MIRIEIHEASGGRWALRVALIAAIFALAACTTPVLPLQPPTPSLSPSAFPPSAAAEPTRSTPQPPGATPLTTTAPTRRTARADVLHVRAVQANDGAWTFEVTVQHPDTGWENYADGWDVITPEGTVILPDPSSPFTRRADGRREIIVTVSDNSQGAQEVVYDESGNRIAARPAIGRGHRWRHQIAVAPVGSNGETELVEVLTPHIGGVVQFYRLRGQQLEVLARVSGYTAHMIGSRNLDMAAAGDFDGAGRVELLLPDNSFTMLAAIRRAGDSAGVVWSLPLGARVTTNLAAVRLTGGQMAIGIGRDDGVLRVWVP